MANKTNITLKISQAEKEMLDFILDREPYTQTHLLLSGAYSWAHDFLGLPDDINISADKLVELMKEESKRKYISLLGQETYEKLIAQPDQEEEDK